jgi:UPF0042 nucleotide-binding protein
MSGACPLRRVVLVTGLSGAGKTSILRTLEDLGYQAIDNLPLALIREIVERETRPMALGVDARTQDFAADALLRLLDELRLEPSVRPELVFATAAPEALLRRYTQTRRRHPMARAGSVMDGIAAEAALMEQVRQFADLIVDTSELSPPALRRMIEARFGVELEAAAMTIALVSFAFPAGLPCEADLVFDARFLRNPYYIPELRELTGLHPAIAAFVREDPDYGAFVGKVAELLSLLLPRFVQEGKRYVTVAVGCTGGRHRSVHVVDSLHARLCSAGWRVSQTHRELMRENPAYPKPVDLLLPVSLTDRPPPHPGRSGSAREA